MGSMKVNVSVLLTSYKAKGQFSPELLDDVLRRQLELNELMMARIEALEGKRR